MKFSILINQVGIFATGLHKTTDLVDWALLEYVADWQLHSGGVVLDGHVWLNYRHVINEMPMLGLNTKGAVANRVKKLVDLELLSIVHDEDKRCFAKVTQRYAEVCRMRPDSKTVLSNMSVKATKYVAQKPVHDGEHPVHDGEHPVHDGEHPVHDGEHSINNQIITNQDQYQQLQRACEKQPNYSENPNSSPAAEKKSGKRHKSTIADNWQPSNRCLALIDKAGIDRAFALSLLDEFVLYWSERGDKRAGWDATFLNHVKLQDEKQKSRRHLGGSDSGLPFTKNKGGMNYDRKPRICEAEWWSTDF